MAKTLDATHLKTFAEKNGLVDDGKIVDLQASSQPQEEPADQTLVEKYGRPFFRNTKGAISSINEPFWAGLFAKENVMLYEPDEDRFYFYDANSGLYQAVTDEFVFSKVSARILKYSREVQEAELEKFRSVNCVKGVVMRYLKATCECKRAFIREGKNFIHLSNGILDFETYTFIPFDPKYRSKHASPVKFDEGATCHRFESELLGPLDQDDKDLIQKMFGQMLYGKNICQRMLILDGPGDDGKSQLALLISKVIGVANCAKLRTKQLEERFELSRFLERTLLLGVDVSADFLSTRAAYTIKGLVGGDLQDAEKKGSNDIYQFNGTLNCMITSNTRQKVKLQGDVAAWRRRLALVRYLGKREGPKIPDFHEVILKEEGSGVLNWALQGLENLMNDIESTGDIVISDRHKKIVDSLMEESDSLRVFARSAIQGTSDSSDLSTLEIIERYSLFCVHKGWDMVPAATVERELPDIMTQLFAVSKAHDIKRDGKNVRGFSKVKFRPPSDPDPTDATDG